MYNRDRILGLLELVLGDPDSSELVLARVFGPGAGLDDGCDEFGFVILGARALDDRRPSAAEVLAWIERLLPQGARAHTIAIGAVDAAGQMLDVTLFRLLPGVDAEIARQAGFRLVQGGSA